MDFYPQSGGSENRGFAKTEHVDKHHAQEPADPNQGPDTKSNPGSNEPGINVEVSSSGSEVEAVPQKLTVGERKYLKKSKTWHESRARYDLSRAEMEDTKNRARNLYPNQ
ncbi:hypothetical protein AC579_10187 [Pseudocercospora musae]|uniref:Uncharacterized protein n=1 Tax=Pseudocercospora musae TaxID=113226 RepID=A0A139I375_9PEZI|nr:hypothetical protein AC579_10187 [Pseudocercospora musae]